MKFSFSKALELLKAGHILSRLKFQGAIEIYFSAGSVDPEYFRDQIDITDNRINCDVKVNSVNGIPVNLFKDDPGTGRFIVLPALSFVDHREGRVGSYTPSATDLFTEDWYVVEAKEEPCKDSCDCKQPNPRYN